MDNGNFYNNNGNNDNNSNNSNNGGKKNGKRPINTSYILLMIFVALMVLFFISFFSNAYTSVTTEEITYNEFWDMLENGEVAEVEFMQDGTIEITPVDEDDDGLISKTYWTTYLSDEDLIPTLKEMADDGEIEFSGEEPETTSWLSTMLFGWILPFAIIYAVFFFIMRKVGGGAGGGIMGVGKSNAKVYVQKETGVTFLDVAGQDEAKESLTEIVDFLHNPGKYSSIGAKLPKGALLVGPPGTGKTLLAKAVAGEGKVPFFSISGSDFVEMFVGVGAKRVRELFKQAQQSAPCIIFIDEVDAIGKSRDSKYGGGNDEREQTLNQLLSEMDGFDSSKGLFILAATNRPEVLDKALLRPGRFDRRIIVDKPDLKGRHDILVVHSKGVAMDETVDLNEIALATSGAVGSDLANMINEAAINAVKAGRNAISQADLFESVEVVIAGKEKKDRILSIEEKKTVAYHEVGHAMITAIDKAAEPVQKITIVPRTMGSLGYVMQVPEEEKYLMNIEALNIRIVTLLAGRAAEEIVFGTITTGAANDMEKATKLARAMIAQYGMSDKFGLMSLETVENQYLDGGARLNCSDSTASEVDVEVKELLKKCYVQAKDMISEHRAELDAIADFLFDKETITGKQFMEIYNSVQDGTYVKPEPEDVPDDNEIQEEKAQEEKQEQDEASAYTYSSDEPEKEMTNNQSEYKENDYYDKTEE